MPTRIGQVVSSGFCVFIVGNLIHSGSRTQHTIAFSSAESESYELCSAVQGALHMRNILTESGLGSSVLIIFLHRNSISAKSIASHSGPGKKSKHT
eukprot:3161236-Lingulodinium_polyedra.AAC.1